MWFESTQRLQFKLKKNMAKPNISITLDKDLLEISGELLGNRSIEAEQGILKAVEKKLDEMKPSVAKPYRKRLAHLKDK